MKSSDKEGSDVYITSTKTQNGNRPLKQLGESSVKSNCRSVYQNETRKIYSTYEVSDDAVHTYYTEGTPANVSHAGSHSDLSNLSMVTDGILLPPTTEDTSDDGSFCSGDTENMLAECIQSGMPKAKHQKEKNKVSNINNALNRNRIDRTNDKPNSGRMGVMNSNIYPGHQV